MELKSTGNRRTAKMFIGTVFMKLDIIMLNKRIIVHLNPVRFFFHFPVRKRANLFKEYREKDSLGKVKSY